MCNKPEVCHLQVIKPNVQKTVPAFISEGEKMAEIGIRVELNKLGIFRK
jgi:hypothetical protein